MNILVIDVGGTHVKILANSEQEKREIESEPAMTAQQMVSSVKKLAGGWKYDVVSIGYPGPVVHHRPIAERHNLGSGDGIRLRRGVQANSAWTRGLPERLLVSQ
jgi:polyphosphate glucokinase